MAVILINANMKSKSRNAPLLPPELGPALPNQRPSDPNVLVDIQAPESGVGTAFALDDKGTWMTARHVVDGCDEVGLRVSGSKVVKATKVRVSETTDTALLDTPWSRTPLARDFYSQKRIGEHGFFFGFPQSRPGEAAGKLIGRHRMIVKGRYRTNEPILAWAESSRTQGLKGSLGGMSGGPVLDSDGEVIGIVTAESPRRGRIYTVAPRSITAIIPRLEQQQATSAIDLGNYGRQADQYRRSRRITQVLCLVR